MRRWWGVVALASVAAFALSWWLHGLRSPLHAWRPGLGDAPWIQGALAALIVLLTGTVLARAVTSRRQRTPPAAAEFGEQLLRQSRDAIIGTDSQGTITFWSAGAQGLFGHERDQALGMNILSLFTDRDAAAALVRGSRDGAWAELETRALHRNGTSFDIHLSVSAFGGANRTQGMIWYGMDISTRKQLERTVRQVLDAGYGRSASEFLHFLTEQLAATLDTRFAFIAELSAQGDTARVISFWDGDHLGQPYEYSLAQTPCAGLRERDLVCHADRVAERFPQDRFLAERGVHAYLAIALFDARGKPMGHMGVMDDKPLRRVEHCAAVLRIFTSRAATELQRVHADQAIAHRIGMEELLASVSTSFVGVDAADFDRKVDAALRRLGMFAGVERCHLYRLSDDHARARLTHVWSAPGTEPLPESFRDAATGAFPWHWRELHTRGYVLIDDADALPKEAAAEKAELRRGQVRSMLNVAMYDGGRISGFLGFESLHRRIHWPPEDLRLLRVVGEVLASAYARRSSEQLLHKLSSALDQAADAVMITDRSGVIEYVNPAFAQISGYSRAEVLGRQPNLLRSGVHDATFYRELWATILRGEIYRGTVVNRRKDGSLYHEEKTIAPLKDPLGVITHFIATGRDISARVEAEAHLMYLAHHDALTELPNRNLFMDRAQHAIARARRSAGQVAVLFLDLDGFKEINDGLGHEAGDTLLRLVADRLRAGVRQGDTVSRLGGDEFTILIEDISAPADAAAVANKLSDSIAQPFSIAGSVRQVSASIGISIFPGDGEQPEVLLNKADKAMFEAKRDKSAGNFRFAG